jgi:hypothetical protein
MSTRGALRVLPSLRGLLAALLLVVTLSGTVHAQNPLFSLEISVDQVPAILDVYSGQSPAACAQAFGQKHGLAADITNQLAQIIGARQREHQQNEAQLAQHMQEKEQVQASVETLPLLEDDDLLLSIPMLVRSNHWAICRRTIVHFRLFPLNTLPYR